MSGSRPFTALSQGSETLNTPSWLRRPRLPSWLMTAVKIAISLILLIILFNHVDVGEMIGALNIDLIPALLFGSLLLMVQSVAIGYRWHALLNELGHNTTMRWAMGRSFIGTFFNQCLPSSIGGDGYRVIMARRRGLEWQNAVSSVLVERYTGIVCLFIIATLGLIPLALALTETTLIWLFVVVIGGGLIGTFMVAGLAEVAAVRRVPGLIRKLLNAWIVGRVLADMRRVIRSRRLLLILGVSGLISNTATAIVVWLFGLSLGVELGFGPYLSIMSLAVLATVIPLSLAGWGIREGVIVLLLGAVGVAEAEALVMSLAFGLALLLSSIPGGILLWRSVGGDREAMHEAIEPADQAGQKAEP